MLVIFVVSPLFVYFRGMEQEHSRPKSPGENPSQDPDIKGELRRIFDVKVRHNRSLVVLLAIFVGILVIWFLKQVENGYVMSATVSPVYTNTPAGYSSRELSTQKIGIAVQMNGFNMLLSLIHI